MVHNDSTGHNKFEPYVSPIKSSNTTFQSLVWSRLDTDMWVYNFIEIDYLEICNYTFLQ